MVGHPVQDDDNRCRGFFHDRVHQKPLAVRRYHVLLHVRTLNRAANVRPEQWNRCSNSLAIEANTICVPSGDQIGRMVPEPTVVVSADVKRLRAPRADSISQISGLPFTVRYNATRCSSGESDGSSGPALSGSPTFEISVPDRLNHANCRRPAAEPPRYRRTPVDEADTAAMYLVGSNNTCASTSTGAPIGTTRVGLIAWAKSVPWRTKSRRPDDS